MNTIVIKVSQENTEDDYLELVEILTAKFPEGVCRVTNALVIETDIPAVAALFRAMMVNGPEMALHGIAAKSNGKVKKFQCIDCGAPVVKAGNRCRSCGMKLVAIKNRARKIVEQLNEAEPGEDTPTLPSP